MKKKILVSAVTAAVLGGLFVGCGSSDSSTAPVTTASNGTGAFTVGGVSGYAMKGALDGATVSKSGNTVSFSGGTDSITGEAPTLNVSTDTELVDAQGNVIANTFTTAAMQFDGNKTTAMSRVANAFGYQVSELVKQIKEDANDAVLENLGRTIAQLLKAAQAQDEMSEFTTQIAATTGNKADPAATLTALNAALTTPLFTAAQITATVANLSKNPAAFAEESAKFDAAVEAGNTAGFVVTEFTNPTLNGIKLVTDTTSLIGTDGAISTMTLAGITAEDNITSETGELLFEMGWDSETGVNANASYALKLSKLSPVYTVSGTTTSIRGFTYNDNTTMAITANSNLSVAETITFAAEDGNISAFFAAADINNTLNVNTTAFCAAITDIVDSANLDSATDGNFTSGMTATGAYYVEVLVNVDDEALISSDREYKIAKDSVTIDGTGYAGYQVIDGYVNK